MKSENESPEKGHLSQEYRPPLEQILRLLQREDPATRLHNISQLQHIFQSFADLYETSSGLQVSSPIARTSSPETFLSDLGSKKQIRISESPAPLAEEEEQTESEAAEQRIQAELWRAQIALTPQCTRQSVSDAADEFQQQLRRLVITEKRDNNHITSEVSPEDVSKLLRFFFVDVFGEACQRRVFTLIDENVQRRYPQTTASAMAAQKANHETLLPEIQAVFSNYSKCHVEDEEHTRVASVIAHNIRSNELYKSFVQLCGKTYGPHGDELRAFFSTHGFLTSPRMTLWRSIFEYFVRDLQINRFQLRNALQASQDIYLLAEHFGKGILVLLHREASFRPVGIHKMRKIMEIVHALLPEVVEVCNAAECLLPYIQEDEFVEIPLMLGHHIALRPQLSLLETFTLVHSGNASSCAATPT